jgi:hypothetical protein
MCAKTFILILMAGGIGLGGWYLKNPEEFKATVNGDMFKQMGANAQILPDFQGVQTQLSVENLAKAVDNAHKLVQAGQECFMENLDHFKIIVKVKTEEVIAKAKAMFGGKTAEQESIIAEPTIVPPPKESSNAQADHLTVEPSFAPNPDQAAQVNPLRNVAEEPLVVQQTAYTVGPNP